MKFVRKIFVLVILTMAAYPIFSQNFSFGIPNLMKYDEQVIHFGFLIGYNQFNFSIDPKSDLAQFDSLMVVNTSALSGFNLGIITNLRIGKYFDLRFIPGLAFGDRIVNYTIKYQNSSRLVTHKNIESVYLDLPLLVKFKSSRMHNVRAYVVTGVQYSVDLISAAKKKNYTNNEIVLKLYPNDFQAQIGVGADFYLTYFKFSTELKMSFGLNDLLVKENNLFANSVNSLRSKILQISFMFE